MGALTPNATNRLSLAKLIGLTALLSLSLSTPVPVIAADAPLLLTGEVRARNSQQFIAPMTDNWRVELQWLMPEGQIANPGEIVAVFDGAALQGQINSESVSLITAEEKLEQEESKHAQTVLENQYALERQRLLLQKAQIDAAIPRKYLSTFEFESYQVEVTKAETSVQKAQETLDQAELAREVALKKQRILIDRSKDRLAQLEQRLKAMSLQAQRKGPVIWGKHPWNGERVFVGMTAQPSWVIAEIPALQDLYVESWLHEVDADRARENASATLTFDAYQDQPLAVTLRRIATQPQKLRDWGPGLFYQMEFVLDQPAPFQLLPGMGARIEMGEDQ